MQQDVRARSILCFKETICPTFFQWMNEWVSEWMNISKDFSSVVHIFSYFQRVLQKKFLGLGFHELSLFLLPCCNLIIFSFVICTFLNNKKKKTRKKKSNLLIGVSMARSEKNHWNEMRALNYGSKKKDTKQRMEKDQHS